MKTFLITIALLSGTFFMSCKKDIQTSSLISTNTGDALRIPNMPLLFISSNKTIHILNATTGNIFYEDTEPRPGVNISRAPAFINDSIAIVPSSNKMFCINYTNKKLTWDTRFDTLGQPVNNYKGSELCYNSSTVFMAYADYQGNRHIKHTSKFFAIDIASGNINWAIDLFQFGTDYDVFSNPICTEETVYLPVRNKLFAFDTKTGAIKWEFTTETYANLYNPTYAGEMLYVVSSNVFGKDSVFAFNIKSGSKVWGKEVLGLKINPAPVIYKGNLFININTNTESLLGGILCLDASDGTDIWQYTRPYEFNNAPGMCPVFINNNMLFASELGHVTVYRINIKTGEEVWHIPFTSPYTGYQDDGPVANGGMVYFFKGGFLSDMYALNTADGSIVWTKKITTGIIAGPVLRDASGKFFYSSENGMQQ